MEQLELGAWRTARRARRDARRVEDLVASVLGVHVRCVPGLATELAPDALHVPPTWSARVRSVITSAARPVVVPEGTETPHVLIDVRTMRRADLRPGERAWLVVAVRREGDGLAVVRAVLRRSSGRRPSWRLAPCLSEARRRPSAATAPTVAWTIRPAGAEPSTTAAPWTVRQLAPSDEHGFVGTSDRSFDAPAEYAGETAEFADHATVNDGGQQLR